MLHYHPEIEVTDIVRIRGTRLIGEHAGMVGEGDLCLIGANLPHQYINAFVPAGGAEAEALQFDRHFSHGFIDATPELLPFSKLLDKAAMASSLTKPSPTTRAGSRASSALLPALPACICSWN